MPGNIWRVFQVLQQNWWRLSKGVQMSLYTELHLGVLHASLSAFCQDILTGWNRHIRRLQYSSSIWIECYYFYLQVITQSTQLIREVRLVAINRQHHREYYPLRNEKWMKNVSNIFIKFFARHPSSVTSSNSPFSGNWLCNLHRNPFIGIHNHWTTFFSICCKWKQLYFPWMIPSQLNTHFLFPSLLRRPVDGHIWNPFSSPLNIVEGSSIISSKLFSLIYSCASSNHFLMFFWHTWTCCSYRLTRSFHYFRMTS